MKLKFYEDSADSYSFSTHIHEATSCKTHHYKTKRLNKIIKQALHVLSVYRGRQFEKGKKSIALGLQLQDTSRTLTDSEADAIVARVIEQLKSKLHATIRDK